MGVLFANFDLVKYQKREDECLGSKGSKTGNNSNGEASLTTDPTSINGQTPLRVT